MYTLKFFGDDGEFEYTYGVFDSLVPLFRTTRVMYLTWTFDGDAFISEATRFPEANSHGNWYVSLV